MSVVMQRHMVARRAVTMVAIAGLAAGLLAGCRLTDIASIVVGSQHSCAVMTNGEVKC